MDSNHKCNSCNKEILYKEIPICINEHLCERIMSDKYVCIDCVSKHGVKLDDDRKWICDSCIEMMGRDSLMANMQDFNAEEISRINKR